MWVVFDPLVEFEARAALESAIPEADVHFDAGNIEIIPHDEWYLKGGVFDLGRVIDDWKRKLDQALSQGYAGMRVNGNEAWLTDRDWAAFAEYEARLQNALAGTRMIVCCTYPIGVRTGAELLDVARSHDFVMAKRNGDWQVLETSELIEAKAEIKRLNETLERRIQERTIALGLANEDLKNEIIGHKKTEAALRLSEHQFRELSEKVLTAREEEGARIAREIHDELGSALTGLKLDLEGLSNELTQPVSQSRAGALRERVNQMAELADTTLQTVRRIASEMRPSVLDDLGLVEALHWHGQQFQERTGIPILWKSFVETAGLNDRQSTAVFRIFQEALTNILRHAEATAVEITVSQDTGRFTLIVEDNGKGISEEDMTSESSLGLLGMSERARLARGTISIAGKAGEGTTVRVSVPVPHA